MKIGYVLCTPDRNQILSIKDGKINLLTIERKEDLEKVLGKRPFKEKEQASTSKKTK